MKLPTGTRMPFMSSRNRGKPVALIDVLWAGKNPVDAYEFEFSSRGRRYRCVTPKICANFYVVDLGPEAIVRLAKSAPAQASVCEPFEVVVVVRNTGGLPLSQVQVVDSLPPGMRTSDHQSDLTLDAGTLAVGEGREFRFRVMATAAGEYENTARVTSAQGATATATARTQVRAPILALDCQAPTEVLLARPVEVCLTVRNTGTAEEPRATVLLPLPAGSDASLISAGGIASADRITWELGRLAPGASRTVCATFIARQTGSFGVSASATGSCAPAVEARCESRVAGIPAILLEVVDLEDPVEVGNAVTYEVRVTNQGSLVGTNVRLVCTLPEGQEFLSGSGDTAVQGQGRSATMDPLARLEPKAQATWRVVCRAVAAADARFKVELTSDQFGRPIEEWEATSQY